MRLGTAVIAWCLLVCLVAACSGAECPRGLVPMGAGCICPNGMKLVGEVCTDSKDAPGDQIDEHHNPTGISESSGSDPNSTDAEEGDGGLDSRPPRSDAALASMDAAVSATPNATADEAAPGGNGQTGSEISTSGTARSSGSGGPSAVNTPAPTPVETVAPRASPIAQSVVPTCETSCKTKRCDAQGRCLECLGNGDCTSPGAPYCNDGRCVECTDHATCGANRQCSKDNACVSSLACGNGLPDPGEQCDDANNSPLDGCIGCRTAYCGDGHVRAGFEQCEPEVGGYNKDNCIECQRKFWRACNSDSDCPLNAKCFLYACSPDLCRGSRSACGNQVLGLNGGGLCPALPEFSMRAIQDHCVIACRDGNLCPPGLICIDGSMCGVLR